MTPQQPQTAAVDVFLILRDTGGRILFGLRAEHLFAGGQWNVVAGKADAGEDAVTAVLREAREEAGVLLQAADVTPLGVVHTAGSRNHPRVGFVFTAVHDEARHGLVVNPEPDKCDELRWATAAEPPEPLQSYNVAVLSLLAEGAAPFVLHDWP